MWLALENIKGRHDRSKNPGMHHSLEAAGHEVMEAPNGRIGLELFRFRPTDVVMTGIVMPELSGLDMILALTRQFSTRR
jgi:YesN/AraC family two-component response regulator